MISASSLVNALGVGKEATLQALQTEKSGLRRCDLAEVDFPTWIGRVAGLESQPLQGKWQPFDCRNNRLTKLALQTDGFDDAVDKARQRYGSRRIGVFLGTSTSGIAQTEQAYRQRDAVSGSLPEEFDLLHTHNIYSLVEFTQRYLGLEGVGLSISTACSSSAKVFAAAARHIQAGWCDAAVVGGVDSLCMTTLYGFNSLELVSAEPCRPWDAKRDGINIGEAAGFALLEPADDTAEVLLEGYGESSDAYHMSTPHPEGEGAALAMRQALKRAGLERSEIGYINLHGTATPSNDAAEDKAVEKVFGCTTPCSSTKGWTGHTLGAAGISEAIIAMLVLQHGFLPANLNLQQKDPALAINVLQKSESREVRHVVSNSFGFGGSNCSLVFGKCK